MEPVRSSTERPRPLFVLGLQRSGTTWLANLLGGHSQVVAVEAEEHHGIHESIFFSHFARAFGDLAEDECFVRFHRAFTTSDYYLLTGLEPEWLEQLRPRTYEDAFRAVMEETAKRQGGASFWVEKSPHHTLLGEELAERYPDAYFLTVARNPIDLVRSRLWNSGRVPPPYPKRLSNLGRAAAAVVLYQRYMERFRRADPSRRLGTHFEALKADTEKEAQRVLDFLGLPFEAGVLERRFAPNSSFQSKKARQQGLSGLDRAVLAFALPLCRFLPFGLLARLEGGRRRQRGIDWPAWCWQRRGSVPPEAFEQG